MKSVVNINRKIGQPNFGSYGASCSFELELDQVLLESPERQAELQARLRIAYAAACESVEAEINRQRRITDLAQQAVADDRADQEYRTDDGYDDEPPDRQYEPETQRGRSDRRDDRPPPRDDRGRGRDDRRGSGRDDLPRTGRQLAGWITKQPKEVEDQIKRLMKEHDLGWRWIDLRDDDVQWLIHEVNESPTRSSGRGWGGDRNGTTNGLAGPDRRR